MSKSRDQITEIKVWLEKVLAAENLKNIDVEIQGNSEKGDGYMGDIVFVTARATTQSNTSKDYHLVLKCSKRSSALREAAPVRDAFLTEIYFYDTIFPYFSKFQTEKGTPDPFVSVPKCYGSFLAENMEVIVLENLKLQGYELWPRKRALTRKHIDLVVSEYGKLHATSLAIIIRHPDRFKDMIEAVDNIFEKMTSSTNLENLFGQPIDDSYELLKDELDEKTLNRWRGLKKQINFICTEMVENALGLRVIVHGDCWSNNFMFLHSKDNKKIPLKVAFLDWQISRYSSPVFDLSYFLFSCLSEDEFGDFDEILMLYHRSFLQHLKLLGTKHPEDVYPWRQFMKEWKAYSRYGVLLGGFLMKIASTDPDEVLDIGEVADDGQEYTAVFKQKIRDTENFKRRIKPIVLYAVKNHII